MTKFTLHARIECAALAMLLLGSCGQTKDERTDEISKLAWATADAAIGESEKIKAIEATCEDVDSRVTAIEERLGMSE